MVPEEFRANYVLKAGTARKNVLFSRTLPATSYTITARFTDGWNGTDNSGGYAVTVSNKTTTGCTLHFPASDTVNHPFCVLASIDQDAP